LRDRESRVDALRLGARAAEPQLFQRCAVRGQRACQIAPLAGVRGLAEQEPCMLRVAVHAEHLAALHDRALEGLPMLACALEGALVLRRRAAEVRDRDHVQHVQHTEAHARQVLALAILELTNTV
jgi:hypothetical protein